MRRTVVYGLILLTNVHVNCMFWMRLIMDRANANVAVQHRGTGIFSQNVPQLNLGLLHFVSYDSSTLHI